MSESDEHTRTAAGPSQSSTEEDVSGDAGARGREAPTESPQPVVHRTRTSGMWTAVAVAVVVLLLLLLFILQNLQTVTVSYFGAGGRLPLGVALLLAAVGGALLVIVLGVARILQLRRVARRRRRQQPVHR